MTNQPEKTPVSKVLLSERINRFAHRELNFPRRSITEQKILADFDSRLVNNLFLSVYFGSEINQPVVGALLCILGSIEAIYFSSIEESKLPEARESNPISA